MQTHLKNYVYFELDDTDFTAKTIQSPRANGSILIPRSVKHRNQQYIVKTLGENSFRDNKNITSIEFADDSELLTIEKEAFFGSSLEKLTIPASVKEFQEGWCSFTPKLTKVEVSPDNPNFTSIDNEIIIGKSNENSSDFDLFIFASRSISRVLISESIKRICAYSFNDCYNVKYIQFKRDSQLTSIDNCAFLYSSVERLSIPKTVEHLNEGWCNGTTKLSKIELSPENQHFQAIGQNILVKKSNKYEKKCDILVFACRNLNKVVIPPYIKEIEKYAFSGCQYLKTVEFAKDGKITKIDDFAFAFSSLEFIHIPISVKYIGWRSFFGCKMLKEVKFDKEAKIDLIKKEAFVDSGLKEIALPENVEVLEDGWCNSDTNATRIAPDGNYEYFYQH